MEHEYRMHGITYYDENDSITASPSDLIVPIFFFVGKCVCPYLWKKNDVIIFPKPGKKNEEVTKYIYDSIKCLHMLA